MQLTRPVRVPREFYDRFRELIRPLQRFMSKIPMQDDECRGVGVLGSSCQAALRDCARESAMRLLKTASQTRLLRHLSASLRDLPSATFLR